MKNKLKLYVLKLKQQEKENQKKFYDTISSFANTMGGTILFGVEENKTKK